MTSTATGVKADRGLCARPGLHDAAGDHLQQPGAVAARTWRGVLGGGSFPPAAPKTDPTLTRAATNLEIAEAVLGKSIEKVNASERDARERAQLNNAGYVAMMQNRPDEARLSIRPRWNPIRPSIRRRSRTRRRWTLRPRVTATAEAGPVAATLLGRSTFREASEKAQSAGLNLTDAAMAEADGDAEGDIGASSAAHW